MDLRNGGDRVAVEQAIARLRRRAAAVLAGLLAPGAQVFDGTPLQAGREETGDTLALTAQVITVSDVLRAERRRAEVDPAAETGSGDGRASEPVQLDLSALPFPDASFDAMIAAGSLAVSPPPGEVLAEFARLTHPGGYLALAETDWASLAWEHPNRPLTELMRQAALRRLCPDPHLVRGLPRRLIEAGWEIERVTPYPLVETRRGGPLLALAERAATWATVSARVTPPMAQDWLADLRRDADAGCLFATLADYVILAHRVRD